MEKHVNIIAALHIGLGALGLLASSIVFMAVAGGGILSGDLEVFMITSGVAITVSLFLFILSVPGLIGGIGLLKRAPWARVLVIIISVLDLMNFPIGTAIGAYSLWVLVNNETSELFLIKTARV